MFVRNAALATMLLVAALLFTTAAAGAPAKRPTPPSTGPTNLRITASGPTSVSLAWDAAKNSSTNWWYCVQTSGAGCFRVNPPQTTFTHPSLWPGTTYTFTVITVDSTGHRSAPSNAVTYTTPPDTTAPTAPVLSTTSVFPIRIGLAWTESVDNRTQVGYTLLVDGSPFFADLVGYRSIVVPYLSPSSTHVFQVVARDYFGNAAESNVLTVTTPPATEATPPSAPTNLRLSSESFPPEAWLDWDAASDNFDPPSELLYEVYVNGARASTGIGRVDDIVYCTETGPNTIAVRAMDTSGNVSPFSNEIVFVC
jgi:Fibronectin type III domain